MSTETSTATVTVHIPTPLRSYTNDQASVQVAGSTVGETLESLVRTYEKLRPHLYTDDGKVRSFINIYRNDEDIRYLEREQTPVSPDDTLSIIPSIAGGFT